MKTLKLCSLIGLLLMGFILSHCTVQKRKYREGFYVSLKKSPVEKVISKSAPGKNKPFLVSKRQALDVPVNGQKVMGLKASVIPVGEQPKHKPDIRPLPSRQDSCGDRLIFNDGEELQVKVYEISSSQVKYKPCDHLDGPMHVCAKETLFMISYSSGVSEVIKSEAAGTSRSAASASNVQEKTINKNAKTGFLFALFSWTIILAPVAFILGFSGLVQIMNHPDEYSGLGFAIAAILIPVILITLLLFL